jgi:MATE family multidrug resistance protein
VRLGLPIGAQQGLEFGAFGTVGLLMGRLGTVPVAGHQAALNLAALTFMVPLGVGAAAAVRVGHAVGAGDARGARRAAAAALACGVGFMAASALVLLAAPRALAGLYTSDAAVLALAASLIPIAGVFQVFDGLQVVSLGVLRGAGDTRVPMLVNAVGFWLLGLPLGAWLGLRTSLGPPGLWWGLVAGLAVVGVVLGARVRWRLRGGVRRVE